MKIYRAYYDSRNFSFEAYAATQAEAHAILLAGLKEHGKQYKCEPDWFMFNDVSNRGDEFDGIEIDEYEIGKAYRDRDLIREIENV